MHTVFATKAIELIECECEEALTWNTITWIKATWVSPSVLFIRFSYNFLNKLMQQWVRNIFLQQNPTVVINGRVYIHPILYNHKLLNYISLKSINFQFIFNIHIHRFHIHFLFVWVKYLSTWLNWEEIFSVAFFGNIRLCRMIFQGKWQ